FGGQEPGTKEEIGAFCKKNYGVTFPMHAKVNVNGRDAHPLYRFLRREKGGIITSAIKWNFTKFLVDSEGRVVKRFGPQTKPAALLDSARKLLPAVIQSA
ncbi:MAG: glutathione peroxidase, partial [Myxococcota bacterium]